MKVSPAGVKLIADMEGGQASDGLFHAYQDGAGVWTIGYGHTEGVSRNTHPLTKQQAQGLLERDLDRIYGPPVNALNLPLNQNQYDATVSFVYNLGVGLLESSHDFGRLFRAHQWRAAADSMLEYDKDVRGVREPGLAKRRHAERALFLQPVSGHDPLAALLPQEKTLVHKYDALLKDGSKKHHDALATLRAQMTVQRKRIWSAAQLSGWSHASRRARYQILLSRTHP